MTLIIIASAKRSYLFHAVSAEEGFFGFWARTLRGRSDFIILDFLVHFCFGG